MRAFFFSVLGYFLTPVGVVLMGVLDGSIVFFLPLGIDFVVILMAARHPRLFWLYAILGTLGSVLGAAGTFWIGRKAGDKGITRFVQPRRLERVKRSITRGSFLVAAMGLIPPPFPFTPFVLASGALGMHPAAFLSWLVAFRLVRFGLEAGLASRYGTRVILRFMRTPTFKAIVGALIVMAVVGTVVSTIALVRSSRRRSG